MIKKSFQKLYYFGPSCVLAFFITLMLMFIFQSDLLSSSKNIRKMLKKAFKDYKGRYVIHFSKKKFRLYLYNRRYRVVFSFKAGYGKNPDRRPKLYEGDMRTPEGIYYITEVLSRAANRNSESYKKLKELNSRYLSVEEGCNKFGKPDADIGKNAYGPRVFWLSYPNENDQLRYESALKDGSIPLVEGKVPGIGFGITIHGNNDPPSVGQLSTLGCIIMYNRDILRLGRYVSVDMPVIITAE